MSEWKVLFEENFWGSHCEDAGGGPIPAQEDVTPEHDACANEVPEHTQEKRINELVRWDGETWKLLSFYTCSKGLVLDYCKKIDPQELCAFTGRFQAAGFDGDQFDEELFERIQLDNPTSPNVEVELLRGDDRLPSRGSCSLTYVPETAGDQETDPVSLRCMAHYGLDTRYGWVFTRAQYLWDEGHAGDLSGLTAVLDERAITVPGEHFHLTGNAQRIPLVHPVSGQQFDLCIEQVEAQELEEETLKLFEENEEMIYPVHFESFSYYTSPEIPGDSYFLKAKLRGDSPVRRDTEKNAATSIAIIACSSGPTSIFLAGKSKEDTIRRKSICSPLFFKPTPVRDWRISYLVKRRKPLSVKLHTI